MTLQILTTIDQLKTYIKTLRARGKTIGFVPTMGALHEGHFTLARTALKENDACITSIFVNPKQFAPHEDFDRYPRMVEQDAAALNQIGVEAVFAPSVEMMYPSGFQTGVSVAEISKPLEGEFRPHFFTGVATVVARLLLLVMADRAYFGEKDFQQLQVIRHMVNDLAIPTEICGVAIVRDSDGLALSSRNAYLSAQEKEIAIQINKILAQMAENIRNHSHSQVSVSPADSVKLIADTESAAHAHLTQAGFDKIDYCTIRDIDSLLPPTYPITQSQWKNLRILVAAWLGKTRLIDNMGV